MINKIKQILSNIKNLESNVSLITNEVTSLKYYQYLYDTNKDLGITGNKYFDYDITISLTTFGQRAYNVYLTITSLMNQSCLANKIVLWLSEVEFSDKTLPITIAKLKERGLIVKYCRDIKSYKKLIPSIKEYPNDVIITVDDDVLYPYTFVEQFIVEHKRNPNDVLFTRGHKMKFDVNGNLMPYRKWHWNVITSEKSILLFPTGCGGILYPSNAFFNDILDENLFMKLASTADDIWFKAMTALSHTLCKQVSLCSPLITISEAQNNSLCKINNANRNRNDIQLQNVIAHYPKLTEIFKES